MPNKKVRFKFQKDRAVLSDVLPFETPISFTNRRFYEFIVSNHVTIGKDKVSWLDKSSALDRLVMILCGFKYDATEIKSETRFIGEANVSFKTFIRTGPKHLTPFGYKINHKESEFRELTVPHPRSQLELCSFYEESKEAILYYSSVSPFSIRRPARLSTLRFYRDKVHYDLLADDEAEIEENHKEYENLRSFFVYEEHSNIYKFYESYKYHRAEKKYNELLKLDISKCFDSIYSHSIVWALLGKNATKHNLNSSKSTFPGKFDQLMQHMNRGETNGIIIGPEFSRIFAELILQQVDQELMTELSKLSLKHKVDYEIFRYVDDYFVFHNSDLHKETIIKSLQHVLKEYKLHLNSAKAEVIKKPIITDITRAKQRISDLLNNVIEYKIIEVEPKNSEDEIKFKGSIYINSSTTIVAFKTIIKECNVQYKDMLNYALSIVERKCQLILNSYSKTSLEYQSEKQIIAALREIQNFVFFIYSVSPRVNTTIRLCRILNILMEFTSANKISSENKDLIRKNAYDEIRFILKKNKSSAHTQVETLYLLTILAELGKEFWLEQDVLASNVGVKWNEEISKYESEYDLNYFSITVLLFYMRDKVRYNELRLFVEEVILTMFENNKNTFRIDAELTLMFFDIISCPYVSGELKSEILNLYDVTSVSDQAELVGFKNASGSNQFWFTTWKNFDFGKELDAKQSQEVY